MIFIPLSSPPSFFPCLPFLLFLPPAAPMHTTRQNPQRKNLNSKTPNPRSPNHLPPRHPPVRAHKPGAAPLYGKKTPTPEILRHAYEFSTSVEFRVCDNLPLCHGTHEKGEPQNMLSIFKQLRSFKDILAKNEVFPCPANCASSKIFTRRSSPTRLRSVTRISSFLKASSSPTHTKHTSLSSVPPHSPPAESSQSPPRPLPPCRRPPPTPLCRRAPSIAPAPRSPARASRSRRAAPPPPAAPPSSAPATPSTSAIGSPAHTPPHSPSPASRPPRSPPPPISPASASAKKVTRCPAAMFSSMIAFSIRRISSIFPRSNHYPAHLRCLPQQLHIKPRPLKLQRIRIRILPIPRIVMLIHLRPSIANTSPA